MSVGLTHTAKRSGQGSGPLGLDSRQRLIGEAIDAGLRAVPKQVAAASRHELAGHLEHVAAVACASILRGRAPDVDDLEFVVALVRQWAHGDVPLAVLLRAYRAAEAEIWDWLCSGRLGLPAGAQIATGRVVAECFEAASGVATAAYLAERKGRIAPARSRDEWIARLVTGEHVRDEALARDLSRYGLDRDSDVVVFALDCGRPVDHATLAALCAADTDPAPLIGQLHGRCIGFLANCAPDQVIGMLQQRCPFAHAGVSTRRAGIGDIPAGYAEASRALRMTTRDRPRVAFGQATLLDDLLALADGTTAKLIPAWAPLLDDEDRRSGGELLSTLRAYTEERLSVAGAARRLDVHPNTVRYRLHRIEAVTGHSVKDFHALFEMVASLSLLRGKPTPRR